MKYKIVVDSSCDLTKDYIKDENVGFDIAPLRINVLKKEFVDDENIDVKAMLKAMASTKEKSSSACPSPETFKQCFEGADNVICITMTSKLSGTFNSAYLAASECSNNVHVIDSESTAGGMILLVDKAYELMKQNKEFKEIVDELNEYQKTINLLFVLDKFDNLVKNGRMSKIAAVVATCLYIKPLCIEQGGEIKIYEKPRTRRKALERLVTNIGILSEKKSNRKICISHCYCEEDAETVKRMILKEYPDSEVRITEMRGLTSFYALENGLLVGIE